ncbi:MAG: hypothetical protein H0V62_14900 [Gammaproteobacteria bacterium]|nr:hypothetical protein [Gammaproteobacteria bacterium]
MPERAARVKQHARGRELIEETDRGEEYELALVDTIRARLTVRREYGYEGVASVTQRALMLAGDLRQRWISERGLESSDARTPGE